MRNIKLSGVSCALQEALAGWVLNPLEPVCQPETAIEMRRVGLHDRIQCKESRVVLVIRPKIRLCQSRAQVLLWKTRIPSQGSMGTLSRSKAINPPHTGPPPFSPRACGPLKIPLRRGATDPNGNLTSLGGGRRTGGFDVLR
ncbi:uncharacterized protein LY79DRAFT_80974 [Colletotrichum navitas]|uniref:Uncharacterized protein n=1 Tax=Colletotrichum navitas TaxID=681940 RepID=A0AAD8Q7T0_9PEZI|nr:uncharacterized protein LY79DRAFT_80974 [Colletotrichum navitas]KAK1596144.1 hypothetical protein LY79DRAFT_80974 [Colletotrichum navitas]